MYDVIIIAEAGVNHNGDYELAEKMVWMAKKAGADYVKFQTAVPELVMSKFAPKAEYQLDTTEAGESQLEMARSIHLALEDYKSLQAVCEKCGIRFLSTPFDLVSVDTLIELGMDVWKIPSGEITNLPYLRKIGAFGQEIILSTGMSTMDEIAAALGVLESAGTTRGQITLLHCNTEYPTPMGDVNLRAMGALQEAFPGLKGVGYSDHTLGIEVPIAAVAMGATMIEKHFTLNSNLPGPDQQASLEPDELSAMVQAIRNIEIALGDGMKKPTPSELKNKPIARKSIVAAQRITASETFTEENLTTKRPGTGISPMRWDEVMGKIARRNYEEDELIDA